MLEKIEKRIILGAICTLAVFVSIFSPVAAEAEPFKVTASGWLTRTAVDANANGSPLSLGTVFGTGTFGKSTSSFVVESGPFAGQYCEHFPPDIVIIRIPIIARSRIMRFANGDLLYANLATDGPQSSLCVDLNGDTTIVEVYLNITGGTGKFAGATGTLRLTATATKVLYEAGFAVHAALTQVMEGEIFLVDDD